MCSFASNPGGKPPGGSIGDGAACCSGELIRLPAGPKVPMLSLLFRRDAMKSNDGPGELKSEADEEVSSGVGGIGVVANWWWCCGIEGSKNAELLEVFMLYGSASWDMR